MQRTACSILSVISLLSLMTANATASSALEQKIEKLDRACMSDTTNTLATWAAGKMVENCRSLYEKNEVLLLSYGMLGMQSKEKQSATGLEATAVLAEMNTGKHTIEGFVAAIASVLTPGVSKVEDGSLKKIVAQIKADPKLATLDCSTELADDQSSEISASCSLRQQAIAHAFNLEIQEKCAETLSAQDLGMAKTSSLLNSCVSERLL